MIIPSLLFLLLVVSYFSYWRGRGMNGFYISKPMMISHRGATKHFPENTLEAFTAAEELGFEGVELDVIASKDGVLYCSHNYQLEQETSSTPSKPNSSAAVNASNVFSGKCLVAPR
jgi:glycerophosphoryl diester phosphodiesterase